MNTKYRLNNEYITKLKKALIWFIYDFSGIRAIYEKIWPPLEKNKDYRQPSTFLLWIFGIYIALYGISSQIYENSLGKLENRANAIITLTASTDWK